VVKDAQSVGDFYERLGAVKLTDNQRKAFDEARGQVDTNIRLMTLNRNIYTLASEQCILDRAEIEKVLTKYEVKSINPDSVIELFTIEPNIRYSDARPVNRVESYSLF
jgi:predicted lactoylglutathione lyase